jgi:hypothetical protein
MSAGPTPVPAHLIAGPALGRVGVVELAALATPYVLLMAVIEP